MPKIKAVIFDFDGTLIDFEYFHFNPTSARKKIDKNIKDWYKAIDALEYWTKDE